MQHRILTSKNAHGFTLIELMLVVTLVGVLAATAFAAYTKNVRSARRTEIIGDLGAIALKQRTVFAVRGHFVTASDDETDTFPVAPGVLATKDAALPWNVNSGSYHKNAEADDDGTYDGGGYEHGWDALTYLPEGAASWCAYGTISGDGTNGETQTEPSDIPGAHPLADEVFPNTSPAQRAQYSRDWFYAFAKCDLDRDTTLWEFTIAHFKSDVSDGDGTRRGE